MCIIVYVVYITHSVQDYTLCCIAYTVWYYTEGVKLIYSKVPIWKKREKKLHWAEKLHRHRLWCLWQISGMLLHSCDSKHNFWFFIFLTYHIDSSCTACNNCTWFSHNTWVKERLWNLHWFCVLVVWFFYWQFLLFTSEKNIYFK